MDKKDYSKRDLRRDIIKACLKMEPDKIYQKISFEEHAKVRSIDKLINYLDKHLSDEKLSELLKDCVEDTEK